MEPSGPSVAPPAPSASETRPPQRLSRRAVGGRALVGVLALVGLRAFGEWQMMAEHGSDPQMAIWMMVFVIMLASWCLGGGLAVLILVAGWPTRWGRWTGLVLLFGWAVAIGLSSWHYMTGARALAEARNPSTSPERLQALVGFQGIQAGYELDNRIAANPNATPETLRTLYHRVQLGTLMVLARNPRTPPDLLEELAIDKQGDRWIRESLARNPTLPDETRLRLAEPPPIPGR